MYLLRALLREDAWEDALANQEERGCSLCLWVTQPSIGSSRDDKTTRTIVGPTTGTVSEQQLVVSLQLNGRYCQDVGCTDTEAGGGVPSGGCHPRAGVVPRERTPMAFSWLSRGMTVVLGKFSGCARFVCFVWSSLDSSESVLAWINGRCRSLGGGDSWGR